ncbi:AAA family ATPase [Flammeovirgaceae bacterium SG7u.111]|nr:AAA family ATPase [Flammeovirgaceae bacterium SG7u.132]WPO36025.1 AAA family ATPase [Flammeovirgaceae bacterium SG7u.111]
MEKTQQFDYITYGTKTDAIEINKFLDHIINTNLKSDLEKPATPICIWGMHGIGKTELVSDFAQEHGYKFVYIAPAQFEEMGDLLGMPSADPETHVTKFIPPEWVPTEEEPGILLIDDVNRADDRILRGIMQLLQNYELISWKLPKKWNIVLTANPDGGDYSVTTMDDAILTRMMHITMEFDVKAWAKWAEKNEIDPRGIDFVLTYPEIVAGQRTTPRSLVQFFSAISSIQNLKEGLDMVKMLADASLDKETAVAFINFINMDLDKLIAPIDILKAPDFKIVQGQLKKLIDGKTKRLDILSVVMTRLTNFLIYNKEELDNKQFDNLKSFILLNFMPNDLRLAMAQELVQADRKDLKRLYTVPEVGKLILKKM